MNIIHAEREYTTGGVTITDCGQISLNPDEQVTFAANGTEYDVCRKDWGYFATPSLNHRLPEHGLEPFMIQDIAKNRFYIVLVEFGKELEFHRYVAEHGYRICAGRICAGLNDEAEIKAA